MDSFFCFGVGFNNFKGGREREMAEVVRDVRQSLCKAAIPLTLIAWYGPTGNFAIQTWDLKRDDVESLFSSLIGRRCALVSVDDLDDAITTFRKISPPTPEQGIRWTRGLAFRVEGSVSDGTPSSTSRACFYRLTPNLIGVDKHDILNMRGRLDPNQRQGGWGAVSEDIRRSIESTWTARSLSTVLGLTRTFTYEISRVSKQGSGSYPRAI